MHETEEVIPMDLRPGNRVATSCGIITVREAACIKRGKFLNPLVVIVPVENQPSVTVHSSNTVSKILPESAE